MSHLARLLMGASAMPYGVSIFSAGKKSYAGAGFARTTGITMSGDGTKMVRGAYDGVYRIISYELSTPYDVSSAVETSSAPTSSFGLDGIPYVSCTPDGEHVYALAEGYGPARQIILRLSDPFNVATATLISSSASAISGGRGTPCMTNDGRFIYYSGSFTTTGASTKEMTIPFDLNSMVDRPESAIPAGGDSSLWVIADGSAAIADSILYTLRTPFDLRSFDRTHIALDRVDRSSFVRASLAVDSGVVCYVYGGTTGIASVVWGLD